MKTILYCLLAFNLFLVGCASEDGSPISANRQPLAFQIVSASVTRNPQLSEQMEIALTGLDLSAAASQPGYTYRGPMETHYRYNQFAIQSSESFLIVEFRVSDVKRKLQLSTKDVQLIDGRGSRHQTLGCPGHKENSWFPLDSTRLDRKTDNVEKWIFIIPTDAILGAGIQFQNTTYPITISN